MTDFINLSAESRYKDTPVYLEGEVLEFALWEPIEEFADLSGGYRVHRVSSNEVGFLDILAVRFYGQGYESLWWVIAQANALLDPEAEMYPGMVLYIPPRSAVVQFQSRQGNGIFQQQT